MKKGILQIASILVLALVLVACSANSTQQPENTNSNNTPVEISIVNYSFSPDTLTIKTGTTVTWTNQDSVVHTVTSDTGVFDSGSLEKGKSFSYTFSTAGTFAYHCAPHKAKMIATIVVTD